MGLTVSKTKLVDMVKKEMKPILIKKNIQLNKQDLDELANEISQKATDICCSVSVCLLS